MLPFDRRRFNAYSRYLAEAIYDLSRESRQRVPFHDLIQEFRNVVRCPNETEEDLVTSPIDRIRSKALQARGIAGEAIRDFEADLDAIIAEKAKIQQRRVAVVSPHIEAIAGIYGEFDGLQSAMDILSNGGPPLEESEPVAPISPAPSYPTHPDTTHELKSSGDQNGR